MTSDEAKQYLEQTPGWALHAAGRHSLRGVAEVLRLKIRPFAFQSSDDRIAITEFDADPMAMHLFCCGVGSAASAEGIEDEIAGARGDREDAAQEFDRELVG